MFRSRLLPVCIACASWLACLLAPGDATAQESPPYQIVLRSRSGDVVPEHNKDGQTGGGSVDVVQRTPDTLLIVMRGAVIAGSEQHRAGRASMHFEVNQDFEIVPTRAGLKPPRLALSGQLIGALQSSQPDGGNGEQGPACAAINAGGHPILKFCMKPHAVSSCQNEFVNDREGAYEAVVVPGGFCLHQVFDINASAPPPSRQICPRVVPAASVVFDPDPKFETRWNYVLQSFRGVPRGEFGFSVLVRVTDSSAGGAQEPHPAAPRKETAEDGALPLGAVP